MGFDDIAKLKVEGSAFSYDEVAECSTEHPVRKRKPMSLDDFKKMAEDSVKNGLYLEIHPSDVESLLSHLRILEA